MNVDEPFPAGLADGAEAIAEKLGFETINPTESDLPAEIDARTGGKGADVVFEVSGTQPGVDAMTDCAATRVRIVMVAIHAKKPEVDMFRFFWRELELIGVRVYEKDDYQKAISIIAFIGSVFSPWYRWSGRLSEWEQICGFEVHLSLYSWL